MPESLVPLTARDATREELSWIREVSYLEMVEQIKGEPVTILDADTSTNKHSYEAAVRAVGGVISCVDSVTSDKLAAAFALVRPPGHHAEASQAIGFCLFNNIAVAAEYALRRLALQRVLIFDRDVHHGNGTMHSFYATDRVLFLSIHQYPHYPGTGRTDEIGTGSGTGYTVNVPLPPGQGNDDYAAIAERVLKPIALRYRPELILVSAGFDIARGDPLAEMNVGSQGFARMTELLLAISAACCPGRLVFVLEGGYDLPALATGVSAVLSMLVEGRSGSAWEGGAPSLETEAVIGDVQKTLRPFWTFDA